MHQAFLRSDELAKLRSKQDPDPSAHVIFIPLPSSPMELYMAGLSTRPVVLFLLSCRTSQTQEEPDRTNSYRTNSYQTNSYQTSSYHSIASMASAMGKVEEKLGMKKDRSQGARQERKQERMNKGEGSSTSSSSEDENGNKYSEEQRQQRKKEHAARREQRRKQAGKH